MPAPPTQNSTPAADKPQLIYKTGFEGDTRIVSGNQSDDEMIGRDMSSPKNDVVRDLGIAHFELQYTGGDPTKRFAKIVPEPGNPRNKVLCFWIGDSWAASNNETKARVQANIYQLKTGYKEFYQSVRVFLHPDFNALRDYPRPIPWLTLSEFWNQPYWGNHPHGARVTLNIGKTDAAPDDLRFIVHAQDSAVKTIWITHNPQVKVPIGKWFTMEYYYREGDAQIGRFYLAITPEGQRRQVVLDVTGWTYCSGNPTPTGIADWNPMKLYTSKEIVAFLKNQNKSLQVYWDDFELWANRRPTDSKPTVARR